MSPKAPSPEAIFDTLVAYQRSAALEGAINLDLFSAIAAGATSIAALARHCGASERGLRSICDYMVVAGFLTKSGTEYALTPETAKYLDKGSPDYLGSITDFLHSPDLQSAFRDVAGAVRKGGTLLEKGGLMAPDHDAWTKFARAMAPMAAAQGGALANLLAGLDRAPIRVLDVAAGHGLYGIALAKRWPRARIVLQDWPKVLAVAEENVRSAGLESRFTALPGDAFEIDLGEQYDTILLTNILHHFDPPTCVRLLRKTRAGLVPGGVAVTIESVVNPDRVSPPMAGAFSLVMLVATAAGDAYTLAELAGMFREAGYSRSEIHPLEGTIQQAILSYP